MPFLKSHLKAEPMTLDAKEADRILKDLDADDFATREKASAELTKMGPSATPALQEMMGKTDSLEVKRRLEMILLKLSEGETVQQGRRGLKILVILPGKEARAIVEDISKQTPPTWLTEEAKKALAPAPLTPEQRQQEELRKRVEEIQRRLEEQKKR